MGFFRSTLDSLQAMVNKKYKPKFILTIWMKSQLNRDWEMYVQGFDVLSVKVCDGSKTYKKKNAAEIVAAADKLGLESHGWGFHYCTSVDDAKKEAERAAGLCEDLCLSGYHWNAEKQWAGSEDPDTYAIAFAESFKLHAPNVALFANCFSAPVSKAIMRHFDYYEPMIYGTRISTISTKFKKRFSSPGIPNDKRCAMVGTGRKNPKNLKQAWGYVKSTGRSPERHGLDRLVPSYKPAFVNFFRAGLIGKEDIMVEGNDINPVLSKQIRIIKGISSGDNKNA